MKKLFFVLTMGLLLPAKTVFAQGSVNFASSSVAHQIQITSGNPVGAGFATVAIYGNSLGSSENSLVMLGATTQTIANGFIAGGVRFALNTPEGTTGTFQIRAWTGGFATYEQAMASEQPVLVGVSAVFNNSTGSPNGRPPTAFAPLTGWTTPIVFIPEPSTLILGVLGATSVLLLRRKRNSK